MNHERHAPTIAADDPRLSEWLDGRLPAAEAAAIERLVAASPELTRLVEELRGMRAALAAVPSTPPPPGFVRDVLAAVDVAGDEAAAEAEVEAEWRRIERQRLDGEIAEARDDAAELAPEPMRQRWPWLALVGALAAGVLVAVVINRPGGPADREVALVQPQDGRQAGDAAAVAKRAIEPRVADNWLEETEEASAKIVAATEREPAEKADGTPGLRGVAEPGTVGFPDAARSRAAGPRVRVVTYRIRTAADRRRLEALLAHSVAGDRKSPVGQREVVKREAAGAEPVPPAGPATERIEISGPEDAMARLAAALESPPVESRDGTAKPAADGTVPGAQSLAAPPAAAADTDARLVIEVIDETVAQAGEDRP